MELPPFLVGAFLKKRVDYSHGFSSVFFKDQNGPELTKIVLPKVLQNLQKTPKYTWWPKELNQKGFPRNIQYRTRPKGPPLGFFGTVRILSKIISHERVPPSICLEFCNRMDVEKSQRVLPFNFFWHCETFQKKFSIKVVPIHQNLEILNIAIFEPWIWRRLGPFPACSHLYKQKKLKVNANE